MKLRKHFNLHLLRSNVVRDIFGGDGQLVRAGDGCSGINKSPVLAAACAFHRSSTGAAPSSRATSVRVLCEARTFKDHDLAALEALAVELHLDYWRLARDHKCLRLAIGVPRADRAE